MNNRRLLMGEKKRNTVIKATMLVAKLAKYGNYGFSSIMTNENGRTGGAITPNPLPNNITVIYCYFHSARYSGIRLAPPSITAVTINGIRTKNNECIPAIFEYLRVNVDKTIPIIFHFD